MCLPVTGRLFHRPVCFRFILCKRRLQFQYFTGLQLVNSLVNGMRRRNITITEIRVKNPFIDGCLKTVQTGNRADLRCKRKSLSDKSIIKRLFSDSVPRQKQRLFFFVIQRERKHPFAQSQRFHKPICRDCFQKHFRIGSPFKSSYPFFPYQFFFDDRIIVDFSVVGNYITTVP